MDISYGGENGFNQAIELAEDALANVKFIQEKKLINGYFDEISQVLHIYGMLLFKLLLFSSVAMLYSAFLKMFRNVIYLHGKSQN